MSVFTWTGFLLKSLSQLISPPAENVELAPWSIIELMLISLEDMELLMAWIVDWNWRPISTVRGLCRVEDWRVIVPIFVVGSWLNCTRSDDGDEEDDGGGGEEKNLLLVVDGDDDDAEEDEDFTSTTT